MSHNEEPNFRDNVKFKHELPSDSAMFPGLVIGGDGNVYVQGGDTIQREVIIST